MSVSVIIRPFEGIISIFKAIIRPSTGPRLVNHLIRPCKVSIRALKGLTTTLNGCIRPFRGRLRAL